MNSTTDSRGITPACNMGSNPGGDANLVCRGDGDLVAEFARARASIWARFFFSWGIASRNLKGIEFCRAKAM